MSKRRSNVSYFKAIGVACALVFSFIFLSDTIHSQVTTAPAQYTQAMIVPAYLPSGTPLASGSTSQPGDNALLIDNFEYFESTVNRGWQVVQPAMPYGYPPNTL
ncbi:MAG: hypothetical protein ACMUJM_01890 [bacterium]